MSESKNLDPRDYGLLEMLLSQQGMFLIDERPGKDIKVVHRSRNNEVEFSLIKRHQPSQWKPDFKVFIEGDRWGSLNKQLFDDIPALAYAIQKRGLTQVEF